MAVKTTLNEDEHDEPPSHTVRFKDHRGSVTGSIYSDGGLYLNVSAVYGLSFNAVIHADDVDDVIELFNRLKADIDKLRESKETMESSARCR